MDYTLVEGDRFIAISRISSIQVGPFRCRHVAHNRILAVDEKDNNRSKNFQVLNWRFQPCEDFEPRINADDTERKHKK